MRRKVCIGMLLLATGACQHLPERVRVEVGDNAVEVEQPCREDGPADTTGPEEPEAPAAAEPARDEG